MHFSSKGGAVLDLRGVHYSTREDSNKPRALNLRSFHFCWDSSLDFCAALEFECHPSVRPGGIFYGFAKLLIFQSRSPRINGIADRSELSATGRVYSMNRSVIRFEYLPSSLGIPPFAIKSLSAAVSEDENLTTA